MPPVVTAMLPVALASERNSDTSTGIKCRDVRRKPDSLPIPETKGPLPLAAEAQSPTRQMQLWGRLWLQPALETFCLRSGRSCRRTSDKLPQHKLETAILVLLMLNFQISSSRANGQAKVSKTRLLARLIRRIMKRLSPKPSSIGSGASGSVSCWERVWRSRCARALGQYSLTWTPWTLAQLRSKLSAGADGIEGQVTSSDPAVRQLLADSLPKLQAALAEALGDQVDQASVSLSLGPIDSACR